MKANGEMELELAQRLQHYNTRMNFIFALSDPSNAGYRHVLLTAKPPGNLDEYKFELKGVWFPEESDLTVKLSNENGQPLFEFEAKRSSYANIKYSLSVPSQDIRAQFESVNEIRDFNDFDVSAKLSAKSRNEERSIDFKLACKSPQSGVIDASGTVNIMRGSRSEEYQIEYKHSESGDIFDISVTAKGCEILKLKRSPQNGGRMNSLTLRCSPNPALNGDLTVFETLTTRSNPLEVKLSETWTGLDMEMSLDLDAREGKLDVKHNGDTHEIYAILHTTEGKNFMVTYKKNNVEEFLLDSKFEYPMKGFLDINVGSTFDLRAEITHDR